MSDSWYYDWINPTSALKQSLIKGAVPFELHYVKDIMSTKLSMFRYEGIEKIPDLTSEILELALMFSNFLCFYNSPSLGWGLYRYVQEGELNRYLRPTNVKLMTLAGVYVETVPYSDIIIARDNAMDIPPFLCIFEYLCKLQHIDSTILKTLDISSLPLVLAGSKKVINQYNQIVKQLTGGKMLVAADEQLVDAVKAFKIDLPVQPLDTYMLKKEYRNECLASIGIYSVEDKRERVLKGEQMARNKYVDSVYTDMKMQRQHTVDELNKHGLNIKLIEASNVIVEAQAYEEHELAMAANVDGGDENVSKTDKSE